MLREALASVVAQSYHNMRILVVDNKSPASDQIRNIVAGFIGVEFIANPKNTGFTGGMNLGLRHASGKYVLFTEDDIIVDHNALEELVCYLDAHPAIGLGGATMLNRSDGTIRCAGGEIRIGQRFELQVIGEHNTPDGQWQDPYPVTYLPGAFILARRELLDRIGGFWDELFMYMEDVELCVRAAQAGAGIVLVPSARVWHFDPPPRPDPRWLTALKLRNMLWLYIRHAPLDVVLIFIFRYYLLGFVRSLLTCPRHAVSLVHATIATGFRLPMLLTWRRVRPQYQCPAQ
jgi:GT2 family glycosyltransferase